MGQQGVLVEEVTGGSVAYRAGISPGDRVVSIDGHPVHDLIDFHYYGGDEEVMTLDLACPDCSRRCVGIEREPGEPLGLIFAPPEPKRCGNRCIFCFVHQLPHGLRRQLYVKDEDYRLSFLYGNYVTLSNISSRDLNRIVRMRLSPLYVSVHATDQGVRERLLGRVEKRPILHLLSRLTSAGIRLHTQIVLLPGMNDGDVLKRTIADLCAIGPGILSIAVVPVGLTRHRHGLPPVTPVDHLYARRFLQEYEPLRKKINAARGEGFLSFADEWYLKADHPFPPFAGYGDFPQIENGVGMVVMFEQEAERVLRRSKPLPARRVTVITGVSAYPLIDRFCQRLFERTGVTIRVIPVVNRLFGESVTVAGLVSGGDIIDGCRGEDLGDGVIIPDVMVKEGEGVFLDGVSIDDLRRALQVRRVEIVESSPAGIWRGVRKVSGRR